jgi:phage/plasmid-associated DNA primase
LSNLNESALGEYFYQADQAFLTTVFVGGRGNSSLFNCKGVRLLAVSEPDDGSGQVKLNGEFIKANTGGDTITTRALGANNVSFKGTHTIDLLVNTIPKLAKLDGGIARRLKIIPYPFSFVDSPNPKNIIEKLRDYSLQDKLHSQEYISEYMLLILEYAVKNYKLEINKMAVPEEVTSEINNYIDENNAVKVWLSNSVKMDSSKKVKTSEAYNHYINSKYCETKLSKDMFPHQMTGINKIVKKKIGGIFYYVGIELLQEETEESEKCEIDL